MNGLQYSYLLMDLGYLLLWVAIYTFRKDLRRILLATSIPLGVVGVALNVVYLRDWWHPLTVTNTTEHAFHGGLFVENRNNDANQCRILRRHFDWGLIRGMAEKAIKGTPAIAAVPISWVAPR